MAEKKPETINEMYLNFKSTPLYDVYGSRLRVTIFNVREIQDLYEVMRTIFKRNNI